MGRKGHGPHPKDGNQETGIRRLTRRDLGCRRSGRFAIEAKLFTLMVNGLADNLRANFKFYGLLTPTAVFGIIRAIDLAGAIRCDANEPRVPVWPRMRSHFHAIRDVSHRLETKTQAKSDSTRHLGGNPLAIAKVKKNSPRLVLNPGGLGRSGTKR